MGQAIEISIDEIRSLVQPQRVHRRLYTDQPIFDLEMDRIFGRAWLFVAHESQLKQPGDFVRAQLGRHDVIVTRQADGEIFVLHNRCSHRGARLCVEPKGNRRNFVCPYHGWTFSENGTLRGVPHRQSYPEDFSLDDPDRQLRRAPRTSIYRGFIFASLAATGPSLEDFLGPMRGAIDNLVDRSPTGKIELAEHYFRLEYKGNWKSHHENANDTIHPGFVHESSVVSARGKTTADTDFDDGQTRAMMEANGFTRREWENIELIAFPGGHSYMGGIYRNGLVKKRENDPVHDRYYAAMVAQYGVERTDAILNMDRFNNLIYPNLNINSQFHQLRVVQPVSPGRTLVTSYCFKLDGAPEEIFHRAVRFLSNLGSPASMIYTDDAALFERCSSGLHDSDQPWLDIGRGLGLETPVEDNGLAAPASEAPIRAQYNAWLEHMCVEDR